MPAPEPPARRRWGALVMVALAAVVGAVGVWVLAGEHGTVPASVMLRTEPPGARVTFNGAVLSQVTPLTLPPVSAGRYPLEVSLPGYQPLQALVEIPATGTLALEAVRLVPVQATDKPPPPVRVRLETDPAQAMVVVDGRWLGHAPVTVTSQPGQKLEVRVEAFQHRPLSRKVEVGKGPEQVERLKLEPLPEAPVRRPEPRPGEPRPEPKVEVRTETKPEAPRPAQEGRPGMVRFVVIPWAKVSCNGRELGDTPFRDVQLPAGVYDCRFSNPEHGTKSRRVEVKPGSHLTVSVKFN